MRRGEGRSPVIEGVFQTLVQRRKGYWLTCHRVKVKKSWREEFKAVEVRFQGEFG